MGTVKKVKDCALGDNVNIFLDSLGNLSAVATKLTVKAVIMGKWNGINYNRHMFAFDAFTTFMVPNGTHKDYDYKLSAQHTNVYSFHPGYEKYRFTIWAPNDDCECELLSVQASVKEIACKLSGCQKMNDNDPKIKSCWNCGNKL